MNIEGGIFCNWSDRGDSWTCEQCNAAVPKSLSPERPLSACFVGMKKARVSPADLASPKVAATPREIPEGPGTELKKLLSRVGINSQPGCSCNARATQMNLWGADVCERREDEIVGWLREEAAKRGLPFIDAAGRMLVRRSIKNARKKAAG